MGGHPDLREEFPSATDPRHNNNVPERYSTRTNQWTLLTEHTTGYDRIRDEYQRLHMLPDGTVYFSTVVKDANRVYEPYAGQFLSSPVIAPPSESVYHHGSRGTSVLLPLLPGEDYRPRVLVAGAPKARVIDLGEKEPFWRATARRDWSGEPPYRYHCTGTLLPTGEVLISGGTETDGDDATRQAGVVLPGELYDPGIDWVADTYDKSGAWTTTPPASVGRHYHATALLMPDGLVWTAGSNGPSPYTKDEETRVEIYWPPYAGRPNRPTIDAVSWRIVYGRTFDIVTQQARRIRRVALLRNGSATHGFDFDQRYVGVSFELVGDDRLRCWAPPWPGVAPAGHYMLWIVDDQQRPCARAPFVHLSAASVRTTAAACGKTGTLSLRDDLFPMSGKPSGSVGRMIFRLQRKCLT